MASSPTYIRNQVLALLERGLFMTAPAPLVDSEPLAEVELETAPEPAKVPEPEAAPKTKGDHVPPPPEGKARSKKASVPPPPGDDTESIPEDDD